MHFSNALRAAVVVFLSLVGGCAAAKEDIDYRIRADYGVADPQFARVMGSLLGPALVEGNQVDTFSNGDEIFPAMLEAIRGAERTINFETYVYVSDEIGKQFADALEERAKAGVEVRGIIDAIGGGGLTESEKKRVKDAGAKIEVFHAVAWYNPSSTARINNRTHRKLLVIDGKVGFTGGVGISKEWAGNAQDEKHYRDLQYRARGPIVAQMQAAFTDHWMQVNGEVLTGEEHFPKLEPAGNMLAQTFKSSSQGGSESMELMYLLSLAAARQDIRIISPYFIPSEIMIKTLREAADRGVKVQVIIPGPTDVALVKPPSRARWGRLMEKGIEIWEYQPTFNHAKLLIIDDRWVSVGSANLDNRSFKLNDEANLNVLNEGFAAEQIKIFEGDRAKAKKYSLEEWKKRPFWQRVTEGMSEALAPLL